MNQKGLNTHNKGHDGGIIRDGGNETGLRENNTITENKRTNLTSGINENNHPLLKLGNKININLNALFE